MSRGAEGLLLLDKPKGPTSHDVVARIRSVTEQSRVGHAGTLDPMASGLLPLVLGRATRLVRFLPHSPKTYAGTLRLGLTTTTDDITGEVLTSHRGELPGPDRVLEAAGRVRDRRMQVPPAVSARKQDGQRLYRLARRRRRVAAPPSPVEVGRFDLRPADGPGEWEFEAEVSAGTYIRALARDLGNLLGCGGTLTQLRRLSIGCMKLEHAVPAASLADIEAESVGPAVIPIREMPLEPPAVELSDPAAVRGFVSGVAVPAPGRPTAGELLRVLDSSGELLGVAEARSGKLQPRVVLP